MAPDTEGSDNLQPIFVSVKQAALMLGISPWSTRLLLDRQIVESRYLGRRRLVELRSLREYAANLPRESA